MSVIKPTHPGEILREEFLKPMGISAYRLAKDIGVSVNRITAIIKEARGISPETALLLSHYFGVSDSLWSNLQAHYDIECAKDALKEKLQTLPTWQPAHQPSH
ncbi:HigA family addiction module antidote protein [Candidatus Poribacteria bacterium]|nr:HigA family addiction module antidote protein [Candidatus Poribacteria bacterium]